MVQEAPRLQPTCPEQRETFYSANSAHFSQALFTSGAPTGGRHALRGWQSAHKAQVVRTCQTPPGWGLHIPSGSPGAPSAAASAIPGHGNSQPRQHPTAPAPQLIALYRPPPCPALGMLHPEVEEFYSALPSTQLRDDRCPFLVYSQPGDTHRIRTTFIHFLPYIYLNTVYGTRPP